MRTPHASDSNAARRRRAAGLRTAVVWLTVVVAGAAQWNGLPHWAADWADRAPAASDDQGQGFRVTAMFERTGDRLRASGTIVLDRTDFAVDELAELKRFLRATDRLAGTAIALGP